MSKKNQVATITEAARSAGLIAKAWDKLEKEAERVVKEAEGKPSTEVRIIAAGGRTSANITVPGLSVVLQDGAIAVRATAS